jgi:hypothetical protein
MKRKRIPPVTVLLGLSAVIAAGLVADKQLSPGKSNFKRAVNKPPKDKETIAIAATPATQSSPQFDLSHSVIAGGGGTSSSLNPNFELSGTIGQSSAGTVSTGASSPGQFSVTGGFWTPAAPPTPTPNPLAPTIFIEEGTVNRALALDSVTFVRGPFRVLTSHNFSPDSHTRLILFTTNLGLSQPDPGLTVQAAGFPLTVENVGTVTGVAGLAASYIVVRLPDGLPAGDLPLLITLRGVPSNNSPTIGISP